MNREKKKRIPLWIYPSTEEKQVSFMSEGLQNKLNKMPDDAQMKLQETLTRIVNEGSGGLICIIL